MISRSLGCLLVITLSNMAEQENYSGVEVIIRLKPLTGDPSDVDTRNCVTLSPTEDNTVVVETASKK